MYAIGTLSARFPDPESTLKRPLVRLSVRVPVANLPYATITLVVRLSKIQLVRLSDWLYA